MNYVPRMDKVCQWVHEDAKKKVADGLEPDYLVYLAAVVGEGNKLERELAKAIRVYNDAYVVDLDSHTQTVEKFQVEVIGLEQRIATLESALTALQDSYGHLLERHAELKAENAAQLAELHDIDVALGTDEGHSAVYHIVALVSALEMMYDKYEEGMPCYENPDESEGFVGNAIRLSSEEEDSVLALIPAARGGR